MELMVGEQQIPYRLSAFRTGDHASSGNNMDKTLAIFHNEGCIPVFISNVWYPIYVISIRLSVCRRILPAMISPAARKQPGQGILSLPKPILPVPKNRIALRFRAPEAINGIIDELSKKYDNTHPGDTRAAFEGGFRPLASSATRFCSNMYYPNLMGYAAAIRRFLPGLATAGIDPAGYG